MVVSKTTDPTGVTSHLGPQIFSCMGLEIRDRQGNVRAVPKVTKPRGLTTKRRCPGSEVE